MMKMTSIERKRLKTLWLRLIKEADEIVLAGGRLAPFDPLVMRITKISRLLRA